MERLMIWFDDEKPNVRTYEIDDKEVAFELWSDALDTFRQLAFMHDMGFAMGPEPKLKVTERIHAMPEVRFVSSVGQCLVVCKRAEASWEDIESKVLSILAEAFGVIEKTEHSQTTFAGQEPADELPTEPPVPREELILIKKKKKYGLDEDDSNWIEDMVIELGYPGGVKELVEECGYNEDETPDILTLIKDLNFTKVRDFFLGYGSPERVEPFRKRRRKVQPPPVCPEKTKAELDRYDYGDVKSAPSRRVLHERAWQMGYQNFWTLAAHHGCSSGPELVKAQGGDSVHEFFFGPGWYHRLASLRFQKL